jgi:hypothetical protein
VVDAGTKHQISMCDDCAIDAHPTRLTAEVTC